MMECTVWTNSCRCHELRDSLAAHKDQVEQLQSKLAALDAAFAKVSQYFW